MTPRRGCTCLLVYELEYGTHYGFPSMVDRSSSRREMCDVCKAIELPPEYQARGLVKMPRETSRRVLSAIAGHAFPVPFCEVWDGTEVKGTDYYTDPSLVDITRLGALDEETIVRALRRTIRDPTWGAALMTTARLGDTAETLFFITETSKL